jgi:hypothetical protein
LTIVILYDILFLDRILTYYQQSNGEGIFLKLNLLRKVFSLLLIRRIVGSPLASLDAGEVKILKNEIKIKRRHP